MKSIVLAGFLLTFLGEITCNDKIKDPQIEEEIKKIAAGNYSDMPLEIYTQTYRDIATNYKKAKDAIEDLEAKSKTKVVDSLKEELDVAKRIIDLVNQMNSSNSAGKIYNEYLLQQAKEFAVVLQLNIDWRTTNHSANWSIHNFLRHVRKLQDECLALYHQIKGNNEVFIQEITHVFHISDHLLDGLSKINHTRFLDEYMIGGFETVVRKNLAFCFFLLEQAKKSAATQHDHTEKPEVGNPVVANPVVVNPVVVNPVVAVH